MIYKVINILIVFILLCFQNVAGQDSIPKKVLNIQTAIDSTILKNYGIKIVKNDLKIAENNASILNSNLLPTIQITTNAAYTNANTRNEFATGDLQEINGAEGFNYGAGFAINYTLFSGVGNIFEFQQFKEQYSLTEVEARLSIETTLLQLFETYFSAAQLTEEVSNQKEILGISRERYRRALLAREYGSGSLLNVLNAEVDMNTDSVNLITFQQQLKNTLRTLNLIMGVDIRLEYNIDTSVTFASQIDPDDLVEKGRQYNASLLQAKKIITVNELGKKRASSTWSPRIDLYGNLGFRSVLNEAGFVLETTQLGIEAGVKLAWNLFDGGKKRIRNQNANIQIASALESKSLTELELTRDLYNLYTTYQNNLFILEVERKNIKTNNLNVDNSIEKYSLGQISNTDFRKAQLDLLVAKRRYNIAKYQSKLLEYQLYQLAGILLSITD